MAIHHIKPNQKKGQWRHKSYWWVSIYYRGRDVYIGCAKSFEKAGQMEKQAYRNFPKESNRNPLAICRGHRRDVVRAVLGALLVAILSTPTLAQSSLAIKTRQAPLVTGPVGVTADCSWPPGTVVATLGALSGGDGQPITYTYSGSADFKIPSGTNSIVVGPNGIAPADCGQTITIQVSASQP